jgi:hypothetical protein
MIQEWTHGEYTISSDRERLDVDVIHGFLVGSYWAKGRTRDRVEVVTSLPQLLHVRRWMLGTRDAHALYRQFGFAEPKPNILMERLDPASDAR